MVDILKTLVCGGFLNHGRHAPLVTRATSSVVQRTFSCRYLTGLEWYEQDDLYAGPWSWLSSGRLYAHSVTIARHTNLSFST